MAKERAQTLGRVLGLRLQISGRLNGAEIARTEWVREGCVPLHTFSVDLDYANKVARTAHGLLGIKIWIFRPVVLNEY
jgi:small subunit ribosomal protein S3